MVELVQLACRRAAGGMGHVLASMAAQQHTGNGATGRCGPHSSGAVTSPRQRRNSPASARRPQTAAARARGSHDGSLGQHTAVTEPLGCVRHGFPERRAKRNADWGSAAFGGALDGSDQRLDKAYAPLLRARQVPRSRSGAGIRGGTERGGVPLAAEAVDALLRHPAFSSAIADALWAVLAEQEAVATGKVGG